MSDDLFTSNAMSDPNQDPTERFLQKTIKLKKEVLSHMKKNVLRRMNFAMMFPSSLQFLQDSLLCAITGSIPYRQTTK
ncbi:hypothetical protein ScPMuIL_002216, partial [Solemya velum]